MSTIDPTSISITQWLFPPTHLRHTPTQQPSHTRASGHADDSWTFDKEFRQRREAIQFLEAVEKDLAAHNPVRAQVDGWRAQQKRTAAAVAGQGMMGMPSQMGMGMNGGMGMGMPSYVRGGHMGIRQHGSRYGQPMNGNGAEVNLDTMPVKDLLAYSGTFGHPNSAEFLHWVNVNDEYDRVPYARDVSYTAASYLHRFYMRRSMRDYKPKEIAAACLYLALKAEEKMNIKIRVVARAFKGKMGQANASTDHFENAIAAYEELILETLCYDLPIPQPLGYILAAHAFLYPLPDDLRDIPLAESEHAPAKKPSVWEQDDLASTARVRGQPRSREAQERLDRHQEHRQRVVELKQRRQKAREEMTGEEQRKEAMLHLAYTICDESKTSPLCLLSHANYIASASYLLANCIMCKTPLVDAFARVDERWVEAFGGKELRLKGQEGLKKFKKALADTVKWILEVQSIGLMAKVIPEWLKASDVPAMPAPAEKPGTADATIQ